LFSPIHLPQQNNFKFFRLLLTCILFLSIRKRFSSSLYYGLFLIRSALYKHYGVLNIKHGHSFVDFLPSSYN
jgi:hypothetical protein